MKIAIMQPYFLPYIGYWQLMNAVDKYVIYDDVNYIKGGWINRNYILVNGEKQYFGVRLRNASSNKLINEISILNDVIYRRKLLQTIESAYKKATYFEYGMPLIEAIIRNESVNLAEFLKYQIELVCKFLEIKTELIMSSDLDKDMKLKGENKVLHMCHLLKADEYWNAIGGKQLYSKEVFKEHNIKLKFLKTIKTPYKQIKVDTFIKDLSILDLIMNVSKEEIQDILKGYEMI